MFDEIDIQESLSHGAITSELTGRKYRVRLIEGDVIGTSGYYPSEMLKRCAGVFKAGTPMFFDHLTSEESQGPLQHGSVSKLAAKLVSDAVYENDGLYADIEVYEHQMPLIKALKDDIGISIRATGRARNKNIQGKSIPVFEELLVAKSADFVVKAGAGGKIMSILESAMDIEESETMELTEAQIDAIAASVAGKITPAVEAQVEQTEAVVDYDKVVELAEALAGSSLDAEGRSRVLDLHRANGKDISELISAEESYRAKLVPAATEDADATQEAEESAGSEESVEAEAQESAGSSERVLPGRWTKGK